MIDKIVLMPDKATLTASPSIAQDLFGDPVSGRTGESRSLEASIQPSVPEGRRRLGMSRVSYGGLRQGDLAETTSCQMCFVEGARRGYRVIDGRVKTGA